MMSRTRLERVGILYHGDLETRRTTTRENRRLPKVFAAFEALGIQTEPVIYHDDFRDEVRLQLAQMDAVLTWVDPIEDGRDRTMLDSMLVELAADGVFVSTHPTTIAKLGTKEVLFRTRHLGWGSDVDLYPTLEVMRRELPVKLARGEVRVLKQFRGSSGNGIWKVQLEGSKVRARHAKSGCVEEVITLDELFECCAPYFAARDGRGHMIDQVWQPRLPEGMVRCYLVKERVEGFGRQEIVALHPTEAPTKRNYHPPTMPEFQRLRRLVENEWVPALQHDLDLSKSDLPCLWDCDFFFGPRDADGENTYVLGEINVSCVSPFPESVALPMAKAVMSELRQRSHSIHGGPKARQ